MPRDMWQVKLFVVGTHSSKVLRGCQTPHMSSSGSSHDASEQSDARAALMTSAVPGMTVTEMRRCLAEVRSLLSHQTPSAPFDMQYVLSNGTPVWEFVHKVAIGLHQKRSHNRRRAATSCAKTGGARVDDACDDSDGGMV